MPVLNVFVVDDVDHEVVLRMFDPVFCCSTSFLEDVDDKAGQDAVERCCPMPRLRDVDELDAELLNVEDVGAEVDGSESVVEFCCWNSLF